ncbi:MAG: TonB-dependent receptor family protein [Ignavibacteria bacterium]|nr:TonB-dependent receptor family protein [Ignavibacteria bacterium]
MYYKRLIVMLFLTLFVCSAYSQDIDLKTKTGNEGVILGAVIDNDTGSPLEEAVVQIFSNKDSIPLLSVSTDKRGIFSLEVDYGKYRIRFSYVGYKDLIKSVNITRENPVRNIGNVMLKQGTESTPEIEVTEEAPLMENQIDKKVYNVEKSIISESGTVVDALKNLPSVTVDSDGKVYLRGSSSVRILINGMPSATLGDDPSTVLDQIPSKMVASIEIMNNPSSKYDPEGTSGIINIILKKKQDDGVNGSISLNAGTRDKYSSSLNLTARKNKLTLNGNYNFRLFNMTGSGSSYKKTILGDTAYISSQTSVSRDKMYSHFATLGMDYEINSKNILSLSGNYNYRGMNIHEFSQNYTGAENSLVTSSYTNDMSKSLSGYGMDMNVNHRLKFSKPKEELITSAQYSKMNITDANSRLIADVNSNNVTSSQRDSTINKMELFSFQSDLTIPLGNVEVKGNNNSNISNNNNPPGPGPMGPGGPNPPNAPSVSGNTAKVEMGIKASYRKMNSDYKSNYLDLNTQNWVYNDLTSNNFEYKEQILSAYANYTNKIFDIGYQAGLRIEQANTKSNQYTLNLSNDNNYFSLFPSIYLSKTIAKTHELQASYTRRINRPNTFMLNPFTDYSDPQNLRKGNPDLKPEYIDALEFGYMKYFSYISASGSVFYRRVNDAINRIVSVIDSATSITTFANVSTSSSYGLEFVLSGSLTKWWSVNGSLNYAKTTVNGSNIAGGMNNSADVFSGKLMTGLSFRNLFELMVSYFYSGKMVTAQGSMEPMQMMDIAIKKEFFDKRASLNLRISDVLNTMKFSVVSGGSNFYNSFSRRRDSRALFLTFTLRFGKDPLNQKKMKEPEKEIKNDGNQEEY